MDSYASSPSALWLDHERPAPTSMLVACTPPEPVVVTVTLPEESRDSRSFTLSTASLAVGVHTPSEHDMFFVASDEIVTSALAASPTHSSAALARRVAMNFLCVLACCIASSRLERPQHPARC